MSTIVPPSELPQWVNRETGVSDWVLIDQARIDRFADVTEDWQFIHIDPEKAKATPFGGTIAHGFLTLSMLSRLASGCVLALEGVAMGVNYGCDRIRFIQPVPSGARIRGRFTLMEASEKAPGQYMFKYHVAVEIEGQEKAALVAEWLSMQFVQ